MHIRRSITARSSVFSAITALALASSFGGSAMTAPALYSFESDANGFNTKNFFLDTGREVVVFDAQFTPQIAQKSLEFIRSKTGNPIKYVILTHPNPDKFNGAGVFQKLGAKVIASKATAAAIPGVHAYKKSFFVDTAKMFANETYPAQASVDITFQGHFDLKLEGGMTVNLIELGQPGVSSTQTIASIPALNAVIVGDLIHHGVHAWLEGGIVNGWATPTISGWIADLGELGTLFKAQPKTVVYGGRGESANLEVAIHEQIAYLNKADQIVTRYVLGLGARKAELSGADAGKHYEAITKLFEAAFPGYGLSYMIQFGVYGLVNSKL
jgi:glyoxylase-like metal-dependent hydrolase (beta-lactamase superfamily II)